LKSKGVVTVAILPFVEHLKVWSQTWQTKQRSSNLPAVLLFYCTQVQAL